MEIINMSAYVQLFTYFTKGIESIKVIGEAYIPSMILDAIIAICLAYLIINLLKRLRFKLPDNSIIILFSISFIVRLFLINDGFLHHDSIQLVNAVHKTIETWVPQATVGGRYGLVMINSVFYILLKLFFAEDMVFNLITAFFASASIPLLYLFAKELFNKKYPAFAASLIFSFSPIFLFMTTYATNHGISIFFVLLSFLFLTKAIKSKKTLYKIFFALSYGIALFVREANIVYVIPFVLLYLLSADLLNTKFKLRRNDLYYLLLLPIIAFFLFVNYKSLLSTYTVNPRDFAMIPGRLYYSFLHSVNLMITLPGLLLIIFASYKLFKKKQYKNLLFYSAWLLIPFLYLGSYTSIALRYLFPVFIPAALMIGLGIDSIKKKHHKTILLTTILLIMIVISFPILFHRHNHSGPKESALFFKENTLDNAIILANDYGVFYEYYAGRQTIGWPIYGNFQQVDNAVRDIELLLEKNTPVYITSMMKRAYDNYEDQSLEATLTANFNLEHIGGILTEDYHYAEINLIPIVENFYRITKKPNLTQVKIIAQIPQNKE